MRKGCALYFMGLIILILFMAGGTAAFAGNDVEKLVKNKTRELLATYTGPTGINLAVVNSAGDSYARAIEGMVVRTIFVDRRFVIVERASLKPILEEMKLQNTGLTDAAIAVKIGKLTPAQSVLFISVDEYNVKLRIVSVESGEVQSYIYFSLAGDPVTPIVKKQEPIIDRKNYHSPVIAGFVSIFPVYSGSWNARFTEFGMFLVMVKIFSPTPVAYFAYDLYRQKRNVYKKRDEVNTYLTYAYFFSGPAAVSQYASLGYLAVQNEKMRIRHARKLYNRWLMYSSLILAGATAADILTSAFYMVWWNKKYAYIYSYNNMRSGSVSINATIREALYDDVRLVQYFPDGLDVRVSYRF